MPGQSLLRGNRPVESGYLQSSRDSDQSGQAEGSPSIDTQTAGSVSLPKDSRSGHHAEIAGKRKRESSASSDSIDGCDDRLVHPADFKNGPMKLSGQLMKGRAGAASIGLCPFQIATGAKCFSGSGDNDGTH